MNQLYFIDKSSLFALALLAVVVVLYLLRMPRRRVRLSSLVYLARLEKDAKRMQRRTRTMLSMALQLVVLTLLVFSAARPLLSSGRLQERRIVLIMDVSASMQTRDGAEGKTRFESAKDKAREIVRRMEHGDRLLIVAADEEARIVQQFEKDRRTLYRTLDDMTAGFQGTDLKKAIALVKEVIEPLSEPQVYLLSDGSADFNLDDAEAMQFKDVLSKIQYVPFGNAVENAGIISFSSRRNMDSERDFSALITLKSTFEKAVKVAVNLSIGETVVHVQELVLEPNKIHTEAYEETLLVGGTFKAEMTLLDETVKDAFPVDNVAYDWIPKTERIKVLVVAPREELEGFLDAAMSANIGVQGYRITPDKYNENYDVSAMIFYNWTPPKMPNTHVIFVNTQDGNPSVEVSSQAVLKPVMRTWDRTHPLMNYISLENLLISEALAVSGQEWMEPVARTVQTPIILAGRRGRQKVVFVGFDPKNSDFPFRLAFPVLVSNSILWFTQDDTVTQKTQSQPGEVFEIAVPESGGRRPDEVTVIDPLGTETAVPVIGARATFTQTVLCGTYTYTLADRQHGFTVNLANEQESDIRRQSGFDDALAKAEEESDESPALERELWFLLNWIAMICLCVESYVYHQRILF